MSSAFLCISQSYSRRINGANVGLLVAEQLGERQQAIEVGLRHVELAPDLFDLRLELGQHLGASL